MAISIEHFTKSYNGQSVLKDVSLSGKTGEIIGLLGPNGAGKSTLMKMICGYVPAEEGGDFFIDGEKQVLGNKESLKKIGYLPEHNPLYLEMYVLEYLFFVAKTKGAKKESVESIIKRTGLVKEAYKKIHRLSKGYRQRVGIAQAMLGEPQVLILDEPTAGLDPNRIIEIRKLIQQVSSDKVILLSTHLMQEVEAVCDRVVVLKEGSIVLDATKEELKSIQRQKMMLRLEFRGEVPMDMLLKDFQVAQCQQLGEKTFNLEVEKDIRLEVQQYIRDKGGDILEMSLEMPSLEEVFQGLTKEQ